MYIVHIASEFAPFAKVGGLADVMLGLSRELMRQGHRLNILLPYYDCLDKKDLSFSASTSTYRSYFAGGWHDNTVYSATYDSIPLTLIDAHCGNFFTRGCIYGCHDDVERFLYFSRACLDWLQEQEETPDVIHIHDWVTAPVAFLVRQGQFRKRFEKTKIILTIHNIAYQGWCTRDNIELVGLPGSWFDSPLRMQDNFGHDLNLMKGGIVFSDSVTTVSPTYAKEVLTPEGGKGLHPTLQSHVGKFKGILNGIDVDYWNPATDKYIEHHYSLNPQSSKDTDLELALQNKRMNKDNLLDGLGMNYKDDKPLIAIVSRLVPQKGIELMQHAMTRVEKLKARFILLGTAPDPHINWIFSQLEQKYRHHPDIRVLLQQEEELAHKLYAASDMFLIPSLFEPCGLTQMIALRYGSIPIVRRTGGLADTVFDVHYEANQKIANGFVFEHPDNAGLDSALDRALSFWYGHQDRWKTLVAHALCSDLSWTKSCNDYIALYKEMQQAG